MTRQEKEKSIADSCYVTVNDVSLCGHKRKASAFTLLYGTACRRITCFATKLLPVVLSCTFIGCKENYEQPEAFIKHWVIDGLAKQYCSDEMMKELHFKNIEVSNARMSTRYGETTICATLRFVPESDKLVYAFKPGSMGFTRSVPVMSYNRTEPEILSPADLKSCLIADLEMERIKMDDGTFAPEDMSGNKKYIQGWGQVHNLMILSETSITESLRRTLAEYANAKQNSKDKDEARKGALAIMRLASYANSGELDYIKDKKLLEELGEVCAGILIVTANEEVRRQLVQKFGEKTISSFSMLSETLRKKGVVVNGPQDLDGLAIMSKKGQKLFAAIMQANLDREAAGLDLVWPMSVDKISDDKEDISGVKFSDSIKYFNTLFDLPSGKLPYVEIDKSYAFENGQVLWNVALYAGDDISDQSPILISANFDCSRLPLNWPDRNVDADKVIPIGSCPIIGNKGIVIITKGGKVISLPANKVTLRNMYGKGSFTLHKQYLTQHGVVKVGK